MNELEIIVMALGTVGVKADIKTVDLIDKTMKKARELGDQFSIHDACKIQQDIENKYNKDNKE